MIKVSLTPLPIVLCVLAWEIIYRFADTIVIPQVFLQEEDNPGSDDDDNQQKKKRKKLRDRGGSYLIALLHAIIMSTRGIYHVIQLFPAPPQAKLAIPTLGDDYYNDWYEATASTEITNLLFFSWLLYDVLHVIVEFPKLGGIDTILHHVGFMTASIICGTYRILPFPFAWLIAGELSTIALNIRWLIIHSSSTMENNSSKVLHVTNLLFALTFFIMRIVGYGMGLIHLWLLRDLLFSQLADVIPFSLLYLVLISLICGYLLNLSWFQKILAIAKGRGGSRVSRSANNNNNNNENKKKDD